MARKWSRQAGRLPSHLLCEASRWCDLDLTIYPKNIVEDIPAHVLRQIREEIENG